MKSIKKQDSTSDFPQLTDAQKIDILLVHRRFLAANNSLSAVQQEISAINRDAEAKVLEIAKELGLDMETALLDFDALVFKPR